MKIQTFDSVWDAIEDDPGIRENLKLRSELMFALTQHIKREGLTQGEADQILSSIGREELRARRDQNSRVQRTADPSIKDW